MRALILATFVLLLVPVTALADVIHMRDGRKLEGEIVGEKEETITLKMKYGTMTLRRSDIERIEKTRPAEERKPEPKKTQDEEKKETPPAEKQEQEQPQPKIQSPPQEITEGLRTRIRRLIKKLGTQKNTEAIASLEAIGTPAVEPVIEALDNRYGKIANCAISVLGRIRDPRAVEPLMKKLRYAFAFTRDGIVLYWTMWSLGEIGDAKAVPLLIEILKDNDQKNRKSAADALGKIGDGKAATFLAEMLGDESDGVRCACARALTAIGDKSVVPQLRKAWKEDKSGDVKLYAAAGMAKLANDRRAFEFLSEGAGSKSINTRAIAACALGSLAEKRCIPPLIELLGEFDYSVCGPALEAIKKIGKPAVRPLLAALEKGDGSLTYVMLALGVIGDRSAVPALIDIFKGHRLHFDASRALGKIGDDRAVPVLLDGLKSGDRSVQACSIGALGDIGDAKAVEPLVEAMKNDRLYSEAAEALAKIGKSAAPALVKVLGGSEGRSLYLAVEALGKIGDECAVDALGKLLEGEDRRQYRVASTALGEIGTKKACDVLGKAARHKDQGVREAAVKALGDTCCESAVEYLLKVLRTEENPYTRRSAVEELGELGFETAVDGLLEALDDREVARDVPKALAKIGGDKAYKGILKSLENEQQDVRSNAVWALGYLGDTRAIPLLIKLLGRREHKSDATRALGEMGPEAIEPLIEQLDSEDKNVREAASGALTMITKQRFGTDKTRWLEYLGKMPAGSTLRKLTKQLKDGDTDAKVSAASGLGKLGDKKAVGPLIDALKDGEARVRWAAAESLGKLADKRAVDPLIKLLKDSDKNVRNGTIRALGRLKDKKAVEPLMELLKEDNWDLRRLVDGALEGITNRSMGHGVTYEKWKDWWEKNKHKY